MRTPPLIVLEACSPDAVAHAEAEVVAAGWPVTDRWSEGGSGVVCRGRIDGEEAAGRALLAAVEGAGLVVEAIAPREVLDRLCDDLRHLGPLDHRIGLSGDTPLLSAEERALLKLLRAGASLGEAAKALHLSRRTADRRLASARRALGAATTSEAVVVASRRGLLPPG